MSDASLERLAAALKDGVEAWLFFLGLRINDD